MEDHAISGSENLQLFNKSTLRKFNFNFNEYS